MSTKRLNDWNDWNGLNKLLGILEDFFIPVRYSISDMGYLTEELSDKMVDSPNSGPAVFLSGAVKRIEGDALSANAVVQGTIQYDVTISSVDGFLDYSAPALIETCPVNTFGRRVSQRNRRAMVKGAGSSRCADFSEAIPVFPRKEPKPALVKKPPPAPG